MQADAQLAYPDGWKAELILVACYTYQDTKMVYLSADSHPYTVSYEKCASKLLSISLPNVAQF